MTIKEDSLKLHREKRGKIEVGSKVEIKNDYDLSIAYTPGVAEPCREIAEDREKVYEYTSKWNLVAVVTDGSRILGLGNIGPEAGLPVMEGKAVLFKIFGGVDAFPICLNTQDVDEVVKTVKYLSPVFGGINLEDISVPNCFEIEKRLKKELDIPVFHDDQHGTAVVVLAGLLNALKLVKKELKTARIVICGAGAAGTAICKILLNAGAENIIVADSRGAIYEGREALAEYKREIARRTNKEKVSGDLPTVVKNSDVFIGVSKPNLLTKEMVRSMREPVIFAMCNPDPEIDPKEAIAGGAKIVGTGRSDFPNQINNVLAFPGIFRGALDVRASDINEEMKVAAAKAISDIIPDSELKPGYILPKAFDLRVGKAVAKAVAEAAIKSKVSRI